MVSESSLQLPAMAIEMVPVFWHCVLPTYAVKVQE